MRRISRFTSYRVRISIVMALFAAVPLIMFGNFYRSNEWKKWETSALAEYMQILAASSEQFDRELLEMKSKLVYVTNNLSIRNSLDNISKFSVADELDFIKLLQETVVPITVDNKDLSVRWYSDLSEKIYGGYFYPLSEFCQEFTAEDSVLHQILSLSAGELFMTVQTVKRGYHYEDVMQRHICVYAKMKSIEGHDCLVEINMPIDQMLDITQMNFPEGSLLGVYLMLDDGMHALSLLGDETSVITLGESYYKNGKCSGYYPFVEDVDYLKESEMICFIPEDFVAEQIQENVISFVVIALLFIMTILGCSYLVASMLTNRVIRFLDEINNELDSILVESTVEVSSAIDFRGIESRIRKLILNTQEYYKKIEQYEVEKKHLELELLQMRFNPHFLYNTLTSIRCQVKEKRIRKSIDSLIHYYRIVLSKGQLIIQIEEELEMIREYLELEIFAYQLQNISFRFEVEEQIKAFTIVKHLLQPIVENALEHGLRARDTDGNLWIRAKVDGADIVFEIEDNGAGMTEEQIKCLLSEPERGSTNGGYGVYNVEQRVKTYYGKQYGLMFHSKPGDGTLVTLRIPKHSENDC